MQSNIVTYDPVIPFLGMYAKEMKTKAHKSSHTNVQGGVKHGNLRMETTELRQLTNGGVGRAGQCKGRRCRCALRPG